MLPRRLARGVAAFRCARRLRRPARQRRCAGRRCQRKSSTDAAIERRIAAILARMSVEEKVGQIIQPDISAITPDDVRQYQFGSILAGGNSAPGGIETAPRGRLAEAGRRLLGSVAQRAPWAGDAIPLIWGIDAVHGHANIVGATIFPHNIGLGATRNPELIRRIGEVTARGNGGHRHRLGLLADARGRPRRPLGPHLRRLFRGSGDRRALMPGRWSKDCRAAPGRSDFLGAGKVIATAKHFVGDGGTPGGKDQGDNPSSPQRAARHPRRRLSARDRRRRAVGHGSASQLCAARRCTATATC